MDFELLKAAIDSTSKFVIIKNKNSQIVWANKSFRDYYSLSESDIKDILDSEVSPESDTFEYIKDDRFVTKTKEELFIESEPVTNSKEETHYFDTLKSPIIIDEKVFGSIGISHKTNFQHKNTSNKIEDNQKIYIESLKDSVATLPLPSILVDESGITYYANDEWQKIFGVFQYSPNKLLPDHYPKLKLSEFDMAMKDSLGQIVQEKDSYYKISLKRYSSSKGLSGGVIISASDITEIKKSEKVAKKLYQTQVNFYDKTPAILYSVNNEDIIETVSDLWLSKMGYLRQEVIGKKSSEFLALDSGAMAKELIQKVKAEEKCQDIDYTFIKKSGESLHVLLSAVIEKDEDDNFLRYMAVMTDVTELKRKKEELLEKELKALQASRLSALGELASSIAHEINNPLTIIGASSTVMNMELEKERPDLELMQEQIRAIDSTVERISSIIKSLSHTSRDTEGEEKTTFRFSEILLDIKALIGEKVQLLGVDLRYDEKHLENIEINFARIALAQVFINLMANSIYEIQNLTERWIEIKYMEKDDQKYFLLKDSGKIDFEKYSENIFSSFFTTKPTGEGTGLGLSLSKKLMNNFDGELELIQDVNTCFKITI
ncbi:PAS domain-containing sensor histidine kinase [bacterium]|nr:PAS domain-containing sensor histidine kinase [bacterium]